MHTAIALLNISYPEISIGLYIHSGYEVQFHVKDSKSWSDSLLLSLAGQETTLWTDSESSLPSMEKAGKSKVPISFKISFNDSQLPENLTISTDLLNESLKEGTTYTIATVAIVDWKVMP